MASVFDTRYSPIRIEADEPRSNVDRSYIDDFTVRADSNLGGSAPNVDVHKRHGVADRSSNGARTKSRHCGFKIVAGADGHHLASLSREQLTNSTSIAPLHGNAGQDQCTGVDLIRLNLRIAILTLNKIAKSIGID